MSIISRKICLVGDFGVGKTSLIRRFVERQFSDQYLSTVGVKISRKSIEQPVADATESSTLQLLIWDIEGNTKFKAIAPTYLQGAKGAILVGDVTRPETLDHLADHIHLFLRVNPQSAIVLALNKADLVTAEQLEQLLQKHQGEGQAAILAIYPTSAKTGENVDAMFQTLAQRLIKPD